MNVDSTTLAGSSSLLVGLSQSTYLATSEKTTLDVPTISTQIGRRRVTIGPDFRNKSPNCQRHEEGREFVA